MPKLAGPVSVVRLLLATLLLAAPPALAQPSGRLDGQLINATAGAAPPADLAVVVHVFQGRQRLDQQVVQTDASGRFSLAGLEVGPALTYLPAVEYGGATYTAARPVAAEPGAPQPLEIRVFEPTASDAGLAYDRLSLLVAGVSSGQLAVVQMGAVLNGADRTYVGTPDADGAIATLRFPLPRGALGLSAGASASDVELKPGEGSFSTARPVLPGRHEFAFSYLVPFESASLDLDLELPYPAAALSLYLPDDGPRLISPLLQPSGPVELGGQRYQLYSAGPLERGARLEARLEGLPIPPGVQLQQLSLVLIGVGLLGLLGTLVYALTRRRIPPPTPASAPAAAPPAERELLLRAIAQLDDDFAAGRLAEPDYERERAQLKARLLAIWTSPG